MTKETVLLYIITNKVFIYLAKKKKEIIEEVDTSLFFDNGEIKSVEACNKVLNSIFQKNNILGRIFKYNICVLYNNVTSCDLPALYKLSLAQLEYNNITFTTIESLLKDCKNYKKIVYFDGNTYTSFYENRKTRNIDNFKDDIVIIGNTPKNHVHFANCNLIWEKFKENFTKN